MAETEQQMAHRRAEASSVIAPSAQASCAAGPLLATRFFVAADALFSQFRREAGLGPNERVAVECLWEFGAMPMSELADRTAVTRAAVTTLVDRLEKAGVVVRDGDLNDRRRTIVQLSHTGQELCVSVTRPWLDAMADVFADLTPAAWSEVAPLLTRLYDVTLRETDRARGMAVTAV
jgi:DNA-binding MarR family transcriptional regulator